AKEQSLRSLSENNARSEEARKLRMKTWFFEANSELFNEKNEFLDQFSGSAVGQLALDRLLGAYK
ncbi:MAG: hypothetical protein ACPGEF_07745, partial [Endozoicomonas sp.]